MSAATVDVVIPALDASAHIAATLAALDEGRESGLLGRVIVVDGGSSDGTAELGRAGGAEVVSGPRGRGPQLAAGATEAGGDWLLFLHADTRLAPGWAPAVAAFVSAAENDRRAGVFRLAFDSEDFSARAIARLANWRTRVFGLPYGDQGLLIRRGFYEDLGGYRPIALMEDVDLVRRIGRARLSLLPVAATTSGARYQRSGWWPRALRNLAVLALYFLGAPPSVLKRLYG